MSLWRCRVSNVPFPFAVRTFVNYMSFPNSITFCPRIYRVSSKVLTTSCVGDSSRFENLNSRQKEQIGLYVDALLQWNQKMNLTAVKEVKEVMERHIEDSLAIIPPIHNSYLSQCNKACDNLNLVDVGSGAGLPGLVLAIACPGWEVTLLESINKRCVFLEHAVSLTGLSNVQVVRGRAEVLFSPPNFSNVFTLLSVCSVL